jgi:1-acyl-sn-glycerol-3-phosphate acyltransferase
MKRVSPALTGVAAAGFAVVNTLFWAAPIYLVTFVRILARSEGARRACDRVVTDLAERWIASNNLALAALHSTTWRVEGLEGVEREASYLINSNHQGWTDIVVLQRVLNRRVPFLRFFIKQELFWVPVLGLAWWALNFPFMKRYSPETLAKHPELRGKDLATTRRVCARLRGTPVSILNFIEGTRFTSAKHAAQKSPYVYLLKPKVGGLAFVLAAIGDQLKSMIDVTIVYPDGRPTFWEFLSGRVRSVVVHVEERTIPAEMLVGDYAQDELCRARFQAWVGELWSEKDALIGRLLAGGSDLGSGVARDQRAMSARA